MVMADYEDSRTGFQTVLFDQPNYQCRGGRIQHRGDLVADQVIRVREQGPRQAGTLQLSIADYSDIWVMPISSVFPLVGLVPAVGMSA
jgi:hypothetical protein